MDSQRREEGSLNQYQEGRLAEEIKAGIEEFNSQTILGTISIARLPSPNEPMRIDLPFGGQVRVLFFPVLPPAQLRRGLVRYAALVEDPDGVGFNYLLARSGTADLYGAWQSCSVTNSPLFDPQHYRLPEPFGFGPGEFRKEMEPAEVAMHIYQYSFGPGGAEPLISLIADYLERQAGK